MSDIVKIRDPRLENAMLSQGEYPKLESLSGKRLVILNNRWAAMDMIVARASAVMKERYGVVEISEFTIPSGDAPDYGIFHQALKAGDFAMVGLAN